MNKYYHSVGTRPKKYHLLDDDFISEFDMKCKGRNCHCELFQDDPDYEREICNDYVLKLSISDIRICDNGGDRIMEDSDLSKRDWYE